MKPDRAPSPPHAAAVAGSAQSHPGDLAPTPATPGRILCHLGVLVAVVLLCLAAASILSLATVRVGFDLWDGIDPFLPPGERPFLAAADLAHRAFAVEATRQVFLAALVVGAARWRDPAGWRDRLGLGRGRADAVRPATLLAVLLAWPVAHIAWVTVTAELFGASFAQHVRLPPSMDPTAAAAWLAYLAVLAPFAEELLMRGEAFARARAVLGPAGAILATAFLFAAAHLSPLGLARPVSLLPLALALGWLRWRTGRLWPCIALHGWSNLALVAYVLWPA